MRSATKMLLAVMVAGGIAACDTGEDVDTFETETTPATEPATVEERSAVITAEIEPVEEAMGYEEVGGEVRIYEMGGTAGTTDATGMTPRADVPETGQTEATGDAEMDDAGTDPAATDPTVTAQANQTGVGQRAFELEIEVTGLQEGTQHAWNIRSGTCEDEQGSVVVNLAGGEDALAQPLRPSADGRAMTTVTVPAEQLSLNQLEDEEYSLHILEGEDTQPEGSAIACADLNGGLGVF